MGEILRILDNTCKIKWPFNNKTENMWTCLTNSSWIVAFGAVQKFVDLVDVAKSFQTSIYYSLAKIGFDTAEKGPLKVC